MFSIIYGPECLMYVWESPSVIHRDSQNALKCLLLHREHFWVQFFGLWCSVTFSTVNLASSTNKLGWYIKFTAGDQHDSSVVRVCSFPFGETGWNGWQTKKCKSVKSLESHLKGEKPFRYLSYICTDVGHVDWLGPGYPGHRFVSRSALEKPRYNFMLRRAEATVSWEGPDQQSQI